MRTKPDTSRMSSDAPKEPRARCAATITTACMIIGLGCSQSAPPAPPPPAVLVTEVIQKDVPISAEWVGTTVGFVNAKVMPRVQGYLLKQNYEDGASVKAGQLLFEIDDRSYKASLDQALGDLATQRANLRKHQQDVGRYTPLAAQGAVSKQELDDAVQATRASEAQVQAAEAAVTNARLNLDWTKVYAPIDGIAGIAPVQVGDLVTPSAVLTTVSQLHPMKVTFPITEREYLRFAEKIKEHQEKGRAEDEPDLELILADGSAYPHRGRFSVANREIDRETGTILVQALFPNPDSILRPGLYAKVRAATQTVRGALLVPERAVQEIQGTYQVAVVGAEDRIALRTVKMGQQLDGLWIVNEGLRPGERVVTQGLQKVRDGIAVTATPDTPATTASAAPGQG
jgi:membrane fusion protein (multidrug efflux system)